MSWTAEIWAEECFFILWHDTSFLENRALTALMVKQTTFMEADILRTAIYLCRRRDGASAERVPEIGSVPVLRQAEDQGCVAWYVVELMCI